MNSKQAMEALAKAVKQDLDYAWSWHCNIATAASDEGLDHAAARFMRSAFEIDMTKHKHYADTQVELKKDVAAGITTADGWVGVFG